MTPESVAWLELAVVIPLVGTLVVGPSKSNASIAPVDAPLPSKTKATGVSPAAHRYSGSAARVATPICSGDDSAAHRVEHESCRQRAEVRFVR